MKARRSERQTALELMPVGAFIAGIGADLVGPRTMTIIFSGSIAAIALIVFFASPTIREYRLSQAMVATDAEPTPSHS